MEYRRLGRTALRVSPICLGTMNFGPLTSEADSSEIMDRARRTRHQLADTVEPLRRTESPVRRSRSWGVGSPRAADGARRWCSRRRSSAR